LDTASLLITMRATLTLVPCSLKLLVGQAFPIVGNADKGPALPRSTRTERDKTASGFEDCQGMFYVFNVNGILKRRVHDDPVKGSKDAVASKKVPAFKAPT
jgi:hypothetical protein